MRPAALGWGVSPEGHWGHELRREAALWLTGQLHSHTAGHTGSQSHAREQRQPEPIAWHPRVCLLSVMPRDQYPPGRALWDLQAPHQPWLCRHCSPSPSHTAPSHAAVTQAHPLAAHLPIPATPASQPPGSTLCSDPGSYSLGYRTDTQPRPRTCMSQPLYLLSFSLTSKDISCSSVHLS